MSRGTGKFVHIDRSAHGDPRHQRKVAHSTENVPAESTEKQNLFDVDREYFETPHDVPSTPNVKNTDDSATVKRRGSRETH